MAKCHTDCIERPLRVCFGMIGHFVGSHPWWFLISPLILSVGLGGGFYFLEDRTSNDIEQQFTPLDGQAKTERLFFQETFPQDAAMFSSLRLSTDGTYATFIATNDLNILAAESLQEILGLDQKIRNMLVQFENEPFQYANICATVNGVCFSNNILDIIDHNSSSANVGNLTFPWYNSDGSTRIPLFISLGSVTLHNNSSNIERAEAMKLYYYLREDNKTKTDHWLKGFMSLVSNESTTFIKVAYSTSRSMQWEFEKSSSSIIHLFSITYAVTITFSIISCLRLDNVRSKIWVASVGVLSTGLAVITSFGLLLLLRQPFVVTVASCPFLILGIGIDDMFIMVSCWQSTRVLDSVADRLANTYRSAAVSISITTLTDTVAIFLGFSSPFGSIQSFCLYAGLAIGFCYLYTLTFLGAFMALNGQREEENKHWFTCTRIPEDPPPGKSSAFRVCCVGGFYDRDTGAEESHPLSVFFWKYYGAVLTRNKIKAGVLVFYAGYLAVSLYGCYTINEGIDLRHLALDDSYIIKYYDDNSQHFSEYSYNVMVAVNQTVPYWSEEGQRSLGLCVGTFEDLIFVDSTLAWFISFKESTNATNLNITTEQAFKNQLHRYLDQNPMFKQDINFSASNDIRASRFFIQTHNVGEDKDMLVSLRKTAGQCGMDLIVYHPVFIYYDQYTVIVNYTIQTILVALVAMFAISLILIPDAFCSLWVVFATSSVILGVVGFMSLWHVSLDSISMINLVICVGFSVDFTAHISYAFVSSAKTDVNERARDALAHLGYPIMQGGVSTILGVVLLSVAGSYIFKTFFKIMFLVILFGLMHALVFIPVFLTLCGTCVNRC